VCFYPVYIVFGGGNITMQVGEKAFVIMDRFTAESRARFSTIGWMDWSGIERPDFFAKAVDGLERLVEHGAVGLKFWKDLGLEVRDASGAILRVDDERLAPIFDKARELKVPVMFHTAAPFAFFEPIDRFNVRYEELAAHLDWAFTNAKYSKNELMEPGIGRYQHEAGGRRNVQPRRPPENYAVRLQKRRCRLRHGRLQERSGDR
jgi:hypothetical protein